LLRVVIAWVCELIIDREMGLGLIGGRLGVLKCKNSFLISLAKPAKNTALNAAPKKKMPSLRAL
jgi:hypothetical protein